MLSITLSSLSLFLIRTPEQCPSVVSLLSESYNPHVRYGAAMALGICCAGTGNKVKAKANAVSSFLAPDCFLQPKSLCNSCKNTSVVWSVRLNLPHKLSFPELPHLTILDCSKPFKNKPPHYMDGSNENNAVEFFMKALISLKRRNSIFFFEELLWLYIVILHV